MSGIVRSIFKKLNIKNKDFNLNLKDRVINENLRKAYQIKTILINKQALKKHFLNLSTE